MGERVREESAHTLSESKTFTKRLKTSKDKRQNGKRISHERAWTC